MKASSFVRVISVISAVVLMAAARQANGFVYGMIMMGMGFLIANSIEESEEKE